MTLLPKTAEDDLAVFSSSACLAIGSYQLQLEGERELPAYISRTFKVTSVSSRNIKLYCSLS